MAAAPKEQQAASFVFTQFGGMDTASSRQCIDDTEFSWLENVVPIGAGNLAVAPGNTAIQGGFAGAVTDIHDFVVGGVLYKIVQTLVSPGSYNIYAINMATLVQSTVTTGVTQSFFSVWQNQHVLIVNSIGYNRWNANSGFVNITNAVTGGPIAVWGGRVWIAGGTQGRTVQFTAPGSFSDFTLADAGGNVVLTNAAMQGPIVSMVPAGDWLYLLGDGCTVVFSEIQVINSAPPVTLFNVTQVSDVIGVNSVSDAMAFEGTLIVINGRGVTQFQGLTPVYLSGPMDGFLANVDQTKNSGLAVSVLFNKLCLLALVYYTPNAQYYIMAYFEGKWFLLNVGKTVTALSWADVNSTATGYFTDGTNIYSIGTNTSGPVSGQVQTKLYDGGSPVYMKEILKYGMEFNFNSLVGEISYSLDCLHPDKGLQPAVYDVDDLSSNYALGYQWIRQGGSNMGTYFGATVNFSLVGGAFNSFGFQGLYMNEWP